MSLNKTIITILLNALGLSSKGRKKRDLDDLSGCWDSAEADAFERNTAIFEDRGGQATMDSAAIEPAPITTRLILLQDTVANVRMSQRKRHPPTYPPPSYVFSMTPGNSETGYDGGVGFTLIKHETST